MIIGFSLSKSLRTERQSTDDRTGDAPREQAHRSEVPFRIHIAWKLPWTLTDLLQIQT